MGSKAILVVMAAVWALCAVGADASETRDLSSYDKLPCPSQAEAAQLAAEAHLTVWPEGRLCDDTRAGKLAKLFKLAKSLRVAVPQSWGGGANLALGDPMGYLAAMNVSLGLDFSQATSIAYNQSRQVYLGALFFEMSPLDALSTLVHESRHSAGADPGHTLCTQGDIPYSRVGCDQWFRVDDNAGAYAYDVSYLFGLAKHGDLVRANREYLVAAAISQLGTRFNRVPEWLARPVDVVMALDDAGKVHAVHPFTGTLLPTTASVRGEKIVRIEFNNWSNGLTLYTDQQRAYPWRPGGQAWRWGGSLVADTVKIRDVAALNAADHTYAYHLDDDNMLSYFSLDTQTGKRKLFESAVKLGAIVGKRLFNAGNDNRHVLAADGVLHRYDSTSGAFAQSPFNVEGGWVHVASDTLHTDLYGIDNRGALHYKTATGMEKSWFQTETRSVKYTEGVSLRVQLDSRGGISVARQNDPAKKIRRLTLPNGVRIVDVALVRNYRADQSLAEWPTPSEKFVKDCAVSGAIVEPWTRRGVGLSASGQAVFEGPAEEPCQTAGAADGGGWRSVALSGTAVTGDGAQFSATGLQLSAGGLTTTLQPY